MKATKKAPATEKPVKYESLRALKIAKTRKTLPRGVKAHFSCSENSLKFKAPGQEEDVLKITLGEYVESCLKGDGFKLAED